MVLWNTIHALHKYFLEVALEQSYYGRNDQDLNNAYVGDLAYYYGIVSYAYR